jgi:dimethylamine/trimethylamine dehydrogenase
MGEEWRKGWHPEAVPERAGDDSFLIIGAGPAGLECARLLGRRGYSVHLAEAREQLGGRVAREAALPGLGAWARVRDYRLNQLYKLQNVEIFRASHVTADEVMEFGATRIVLATGGTWRRDGVGRANAQPVPGFDRQDRVFSPDDLMNGVRVPGTAIVFDDDHYYLGAILAEQLRAAGLAVTLVTPADRVSAWTVNTLEQHAIQRRVMELGIDILAGRNIVEFDGARGTSMRVHRAPFRRDGGLHRNGDLAPAERRSGGGARRPDRRGEKRRHHFRRLHRRLSCAEHDRGRCVRRAPLRARVRPSAER